MEADITSNVLNEIIGYHKGALSVLAKEKDDLVKRLHIIEQMMEMHIQALRELGVNLMQESEGTAHT